MMACRLYTRAQRCALWFVALVFAAGSNSAGAQVVRGTVTDERTAAPLRAVVTLMTAGSVPTDRRAITSDDGTYALRAPSAGTFVLEVRAIGFVRHRSAPMLFAPGETRIENVVLRPIATRLANVRVPARSSCRRAGDMERVATEVWDDIWTALAAAAIAQEQHLVRADIFRYARELDAQSEEVRWEERNTLSGVTDRPFRAAAAGDLARLGFRHESDDGTSITFFAPDAQTLISPEFLATHCFALTRADTAGGTRLGLVFRPQDARAPNDVEGTLWIDAESRQLRTLEFMYIGLPDLRGQHFGGRLSFTRLQNGLWVDDRWLIRAPLLRRLIRGTQRFRGLRLEGEVRDSVLAVREEGGFVLTDSVRAHLFARVDGRVTTAGVSGNPLPNTQVALVGTGLRGRTDSTGTFGVGEVLPGKYEVRVHRSGPGDAGAFVRRRTLELRAGQSSTLDVSAPSDTVVAAELCPGWKPRSPTAPLLAVVRDSRTEQPIQNHTLELEWTQYVISTKPITIKQRIEKQNVTTDWRGELVFCGLPDRSDVRFRDAQAALPEWSPPVRAGFRLLVVDLSINPATGAVAWQTADSSSATVANLTPNESAAGRARLLGSVAPSDSANVRLPDVQVSVDGTDLTTRTDARGEFRFDSVPDGWYVVSARRPGFAPFSSAMLLRRGAATQLRIRLQRVQAELAEVRVEERSPLSIGMIGFEERRKAKIGSFIGPDELEKYTGPTLSGLIANKIPGFDLVPLITNGYMSGGFGIASKHYQQMRAGIRQLCFAKVVVNGQRFTSGNRDIPLNIDELKPGELVGMEFYRGASEVPTEFSGPDAACGVVIIWTKQR